MTFNLVQDDGWTEPEPEMKRVMAEPPEWETQLRALDLEATQLQTGWFCLHSATFRPGVALPPVDHLLLR